jgi:hypothetical protein
VFFGPIGLKFLQEDKKTSICEIVWANISTNFQKEGIINFLFKFSKTILLDAPKNGFRKKSGTIYPIEQREVSFS